MKCVQSFRPMWRLFVLCAVAVAMAFLFSAECAAQTDAQTKPSDEQWLSGLSKNPELMKALGRLVEQLRGNVHFPPPRAESHLLPLLPETTVAYLAYPNYGEVVHQALITFRQERETSPALAELWRRKDVAEIGQKVEEVLDKVYQLSQYLGDEVVVSGGLEGKSPKPLFVAEVRKPGLKAALEQFVSDLSGKSPPALIVFDQEELEIAKDRKPGPEPVVLVRPDYVIGAYDVPMLRSFNARLNQTARGFPSVPFGQRILQAYQGGVTVVGAADLQKLLNLIPITSEKDRATFQRTGFADMKYLVWDHKTVEGQEISESELSFLGPRHGVASWLRAPTQPGSLDFVSPGAIFAATLMLKNLGEIFDDVHDLASGAASDPFAQLSAMEQALQLSVKDDLLRLLRGEITVELDAISPVAWKAVIQVSEPEHLQNTLAKLLTLVNFQIEQSEDAGLSYYKVRIPSKDKPTEIDYAYVDGYLVAASNREAAAEAVRLHKAGESLGKSKKLAATRPPGQPPGLSAMFYQDSMGATMVQLKQVAPEMADTITKAASESVGSAIYAYGDETAVRGASKNMGFDVGAMLVVAAIAIPNLLRSRMAANEASAAGMLRTLNTAQVTYSTAYGNGFAPDLAKLGPDPSGGKPSPEHADLVASPLGDANCTARAWCENSGYRFTLKAICIQQLCATYVLVATPVSNDTGTRNFCSVEDGVIRFQAGPPLTAPVSSSECRKWPPIQ